jgi:hypothetical protein
LVTHGTILKFFFEIKYTALGFSGVTTTPLHPNRLGNAKWRLTGIEVFKRDGILSSVDHRGVDRYARCPLLLNYALILLSEISYGVRSFGVWDGGISLIMQWKL